MMDKIYAYKDLWFVLYKDNGVYKRFWEGTREGVDYEDEADFLRDKAHQGYIDTGWHKDDIEVYRLFRAL